MRTKLMIAFLSLCFFASSCEDPTNRENYQERDIVYPPPVTRLPSHRGVYVNDFSTILGNTTLENDLLNWSQTHWFNRINLYNIGTLLPGSSSQLNAFVGLAKSAPSNLKVSFIASGTTGMSKIQTYYNSLAFPNKPDAVTSEYEFWNSGNSFSGFLSLSAGMNSLHTSYPIVDREIYVSQFSDFAGVYTQTQIADYIVNNCEKVYLVNYVANAYNYGPTLHNKLQILANAGQAAGKVVNVVLIFNVNTGSADPNIYNYFDINGLNHPFQDAFNNVRSGYLAGPPTNSSFLNLQGYQIYRYSNAKLARP